MPACPVHEGLDVHSAHIIQLPSQQLQGNQYTWVWGSPRYLLTHCTLLDAQVTMEHPYAVAEEDTDTSAYRDCQPSISKNLQKGRLFSVAQLSAVLARKPQH